MRYEYSDKAIYSDLARDLLAEYPEDYCTVYFGFIVEAVIEAVNDLGGNIDLPEVHKQVIANYI